MARREDIEAGMARAMGNAFESCAYCRHKHLYKSKCKAFPDGIPNDLLTGQATHHEARKGDHGIRFEPRSTRGVH